MIRRICLVLFLGLMLIMVSGLVQAQTPRPTTSSSYPTRTDLYVNDLGNVLSPSEETSLREIVRTISKDFDLTVLTIDGIVDYDPTEPSIETFSTNVFNRWEIGTQAKNTGVLVVLAMRNRDVRIELGDGYGTEYDDDMMAVIQEYIIPRFKQNNFAAGLTDGVNQIYREITGRLPNESLSGTPRPRATPIVSTPRPSTSRSTTTYNSSNTSSDVNDLVPLAAGAAGVAGVGGLGAYAFREIMRRRPRKCSICGAMMVRLDEWADDAYLSEGQKLEEVVGSVNYDVWECSSCQHRDMYDYSAWFSGYSPCDQCGYRTLSRSSTVLDHATQYSTGLRLVETNCQHCNYHQEWEEIIPMVSRSRSSGSSFSSGGGSSSGGGGGGSSSGGGASGSW